MCLLALFFRVVENAAVVVGANREEYYQRGGEPPILLPGPLRAVAGLDPVAGGTWLGVNEKQLLVAVTNRPKLDVPANPRSRGLLVRELLACSSAEAAVNQAVDALEQGHYAGANFLCVDARRAVVIQAGDWLRIRPLPPGIHVMTNRDINDASDARVGYALDWFNRRRYRTPSDCVQALTQLCAKHQPNDPPICFRHPDRGTVSSSIVALGDSLPASLYLHAQGPPCRTVYADYSHFLHTMKADREV
jgi:uncharacterized protein with NRDE domain